MYRIYSRNSLLLGEFPEGSYSAAEAAFKLWGQAMYLYHNTTLLKEKEE